MTFCSILVYSIYFPPDILDCPIKDEYKFSKEKLILYKDNQFKSRLIEFENKFPTTKPATIENYSSANLDAVWTGKCINDFVIIYRFYNKSDKEENEIIEYYNTNLSKIPLRILFRDRTIL